MDASVKPTEMRDYTVQTRYLFLRFSTTPFILLLGSTGRVLQAAGALRTR